MTALPSCLAGGSATRSLSHRRRIRAVAGRCLDHAPAAGESRVISVLVTGAKSELMALRNGKGGVSSANSPVRQAETNRAQPLQMQVWRLGLLLEPPGARLRFRDND